MQLTEGFQQVTELGSFGQLIPQSQATVYAWKTKEPVYNTQLVLYTGDYYYKIYTLHPNNYWDGVVVRRALASIYQDWGLMWELQEVEINGSSYLVEKREALEVASNYTEQELLQYNFELFSELGQRLNLKAILREVQKKVPNVHDIQISRTCIIKNIDYGRKGDRLILLDDADFVLTMYDQNYDVITLPILDLIVEVGDQLYRLLPSQCPISRLDPANLLREYDKWLLYPTVSNDLSPVYLRSLYDKTISYYQSWYGKQKRLTYYDHCSR